MLSLIKNFRHIIITIGILLLILGTWYFFSNRQIKEAPDRADLVLYGQSVENTEGHNG